MKWHAEGNPLVYAKLAPNKQTWFLDKGDKATGGNDKNEDSQYFNVELYVIFFFFYAQSNASLWFQD